MGFNTPMSFSFNLNSLVVLKLSKSFFRNLDYLYYLKMPRKLKTEDHIKQRPGRMDPGFFPFCKKTRESGSVSFHGVGYNSVKIHDANPSYFGWQGHLVFDETGYSHYYDQKINMNSLQNFPYGIFFYTFLPPTRVKN